MKTLLQLTKALNDAKAEVDKARRALAKAEGKSATRAATDALETALRGKIDAQTALDAAQSADAKTTTVKHLKHEEKVTVKDEDEPEDEEEEEASDAGSGAPSATGSTAASTTGSDSAEEEEEEGALAKGYAAAEQAFHVAIKGHRAAASLALHSPARLRRLGRQVTGQKGTREIFGALDGLQQTLAAAEKTQARVAKLEAHVRASKVDAILERAKSEGRVVAKEHREVLRADAMRQGTKWLKAHVAALPKLVRTTIDGELVARADENGNPVGGPTAEDQKKILDTMFAGLPEDAQAKARADFETRARSTKNGAAPTH